ncbi:VapA/VapB family virulence-associated protein [Xenorhabdus khoisanae]|uniref:VapA/VapB family virulence-associated protein n=1 Tax=Xenorhabdus khoisanae TaxID=880157 RepID=UPI002359D834|nr:VapA/VapB family virulence-associated protein [Xenorhabdus khoisanae]MDC9615680.1 VapA/VapB family virulence-associated protein [Xenorhabdus khoisanae]
MKKTLPTESGSSLYVEKGLKIIESLSEALASNLEQKTIDDSSKKLSELSAGKYEATFVLISFSVYYTCTLYVEGAKTFYGKAGGFGSPGKGEFSGHLYVYEDDLNNLYEKGTAFIALMTPITAAVAFTDSPLNKIAQFEGTGRGTISATILGGGYWE